MYLSLTFFLTPLRGVAAPDLNDRYRWRVVLRKAYEVELELPWCPTLRISTYMALLSYEHKSCSTSNGASE
jgi:hypothetical protein